jgi:CDGSH-type Zn-finger protein
MPRLVRFEATGPIRIDPQDKPVFICGCGLTRNFPFCDGTHKACKDEQEGKVYVYDAESGEVTETRDDA